MTSNPNVKSTPLFDVEYLRNGTRLTDIVIIEY